MYPRTVGSSSSVADDFALDFLLSGSGTGCIRTVLGFPTSIISSTAISTGGDGCFGPGTLLRLTRMPSRILATLTSYSGVPFLGQDALAASDRAGLTVAVFTHRLLSSFCGSLRASRPTTGDV